MGRVTNSLGNSNEWPTGSGLAVRGVYLSVANSDKPYGQPVVRGNTIRRFFLVSGDIGVYLKRCQQAVIEKNLMEVATNNGVSYTNCTHVNVIGDSRMDGTPLLGYEPQPSSTTRN